MEKDDEVSGNGNSYTATYWQYDSRLGRRWNVDPVNKAYLSSYCSFGNNPIVFVDPNGDDHYFNQAGEYIGSDHQGDDLRIINTSIVNKTFKFILDTKGANFLKTNSMLICFDEEQIKQMATELYKKASSSSREALSGMQEEGGIIVIDPETAIATLVPKPNALGEVKQTKENSAENHYSYGNVVTVGFGTDGEYYEVILKDGEAASSSGFGQSMVDYLVIGEYHTHQGTEFNSSNMLTTGSRFSANDVAMEASNPDGDRAKKVNHSVFSLDSEKVNSSHPNGHNTRTNSSELGKIAEQALRSKIKETDEQK
jgi:hypothetical protein